MSPLATSSGRLLFGALPCWAFLLIARRKLWLGWRFVGQCVVLGLLQFGLPFAIYPAAQVYITSGAAGIINALTPIMVVIVSHFWPGGEKATLLRTLGVIAGFVGIVLLAVPALQAGGGSEAWGLMFAALAPLCYGFALNYVRRLKGYDPVVMLTWALTIVAVLLGGMSLMVEGVPVIRHAETWAALVTIGAVLTGFAFIVFYWLLPRVGATALSTVTFVAPISAVWLGIWLLDETLTVWSVLGLMAIFLGLLLIDGRLFRRRTAGQAVGR